MNGAPTRAAATAELPRPRNGSTTSPRRLEAVQAQALLGQARREGGRVRPLAIAALDGLVGDEPGVAAAARASRRRRPAPDVGTVLIRHADRAAVQRRRGRRREVEHELVAVVEEPRAVDGLVVADGQVAFEAGAGAGQVAIDRDRLHPVDDVLEAQVLARLLRDVERGPGVGWLAADVQEQRALGGQRAAAARSQSLVQRKYSSRGCPSSKLR